MQQTINSDATQESPKEGLVTRKVEQMAAKIPSMSYIGLAVASMGLSAGLALFTKRKSVANFVGLWVPTILILGLYNKLVSLEESDRWGRVSLH